MERWPAANVHLLGSRPYAELPGYLQHADLGLLPFNNHPGNAARSPMKLYEYAAAGLPVVARRTPELERRNEPFVHFYDDASALPAVCREVLALPGGRAAIVARAAAHGWARKAELLLQLVRAVLVRKREPLAARPERPTGRPSTRSWHQTR